MRRLGQDELESSHRPDRFPGRLRGGVGSFPQSGEEQTTGVSFGARRPLGGAEKLGGAEECFRTTPSRSWLGRVRLGAPVVRYGQSLC